MSSPKKKSIFSDAELKAMRLADEEIEKQFSLSREDMDLSRRLDRQAKIDRLDNKGRKIADYQAAYYQANKDKIAAQKAAYYQANKDKIAAQKAAYYQANKDKWNAYQRDYRRRKKLLALQEQEKAALDAANIKDDCKK